MWPSRGDEEARADRGLAGAALEHGADLHQLRARLLVDLARRERDRRRRRGAAAASWAGGAAGAVAARRRRAAAPDADAAASASTTGWPSVRRELSSATILRAGMAQRARARPRCYSRRRLSARAPTEDTRRPRMQRRRLIRAALAGPAAVSALPAFGRAQALEKPKLTIAVGGKNLLYYLPLTIAESLGYFKAEGPRHHDRRFRRRLARPAGAGRRQRRRRLGRVRAHDQHAGQGPAPARLRAAGARAADRARHQSEDDAELQVGRRPEGQEARRHRAGLVDQRARQLRARQGRAEAERRLDHRRRRRQRRGRGDALRARSTRSPTSTR